MEEMQQMGAMQYTDGDFHTRQEWKQINLRSYHNRLISSLFQYIQIHIFSVYRVVHYCSVNKKNYWQIYFSYEITEMIEGNSCEIAVFIGHFLWAISTTNHHPHRNYSFVFFIYSFVLSSTVFFMRSWRNCWLNRCYQRSKCKSIFGK